MDLTPREIQERQFHDAFRGYSHEEVDVFLDEVAEAFERIYRENQSFHHRLKQLEEELRIAKATEDMLKRTLITAQKTAEEAVEEARTKAQHMIKEAESKATGTVEAAEREATDKMEKANSLEHEISVSLEGLKKFEQEYRARLKAFIESQLRVLEEGPVAPETPPPAAVSQSGGFSASGVREASSTRAPGRPPGRIDTPPLKQEAPAPAASPVSPTSSSSPGGSSPSSGSSEQPSASEHRQAKPPGPASLPPSTTTRAVPSVDPKTASQPAPNVSPAIPGTQPVSPAGTSRSEMASSTKAPHEPRAPGGHSQGEPQGEKTPPRPSGVASAGTNAGTDPGEKTRVEPITKSSSVAGVPTPPEKQQQSAGAVGARPPGSNGRKESEPDSTKAAVPDSKESASKTSKGSDELEPLFGKQAQPDDDAEDEQSIKKLFWGED